MSISSVTKQFLSKAIDFKNEGTKNKWVTDLITELESTIDAVNNTITVVNAIPTSQPPGSYITALTGDVLATGPGSVAATLANIAANSILGNNTGSSAHQIALTAAQVKALLAIVEADITLSDNTTDNVTISAHGYAPKSANDTTKFLQAANPPGWAVLPTPTIPVQPIFDFLVSGVAVTSVTTNGIVTLDAGTHGGYGFEFLINNPTGAAVTYSLYFNNDTTATDYFAVSAYVQTLANNAILVGNQTVPASGRVAIDGVITQDASGLVVAFLRYIIFNADGTYAVEQEERLFKTTAVSGSNLTRIDVVCNTSGHIDVNSRFRLWRRK